MTSGSLTLLILILAFVGYWLAIQRSIKVAGGRHKIGRLASLPTQYALLTALWCAIPSIVILAIWLAVEGQVIDWLVVSYITELHTLGKDLHLSLFLNSIKIIANDIRTGISPESFTDLQREAASFLIEIENKAMTIKTIVMLVIALSSVTYVLAKIKKSFHARRHIETIVKTLLLLCSGIALLTTLGIVLSVLVESIRFFSLVPITEFLFGTTWSPQIALRVDQVAGSGAFGAIPLFVGTILISMIAMLMSVPIGLMIAIYLSQYATPKIRSTAKPMLEILAGVPTVVYGFFAALTIAPMMRDFGVWVGMPIAAESALAAGTVMGIMIIPFVSSLSEDALTAVPDSLKEGSLAMGATQSETIRRVLIPSAVPGIVGAVLLAVSRAIGETMIVVMAAGLAANLTLNPADSVTTVTVQIVTLLTGDQEFDSAKTLAAFALGLMLFIVTLSLNIGALKIVRRYREQYE